MSLVPLSVLLNSLDTQARASTLHMRDNAGVSTPGLLSCICLSPHKTIVERRSGDLLNKLQKLPHFMYDQLYFKS